MHTDGYVQALRDDLLRVAAVGDESTARVAELLAVALESSVGRRLQEALAEAALELSAQLERGHVEVRVAGADVQLVLVHEDGEPEPPADSALDARITLRLPEELKRKIEDAAARAGVSVNSWIVRALSRDSAPPHTGGTRYRLTGYGRS